MEREIIFRGKRIATKKWIYGGYAVYDSHAFILVNGNPYPIIPSTICQYTGLKDRNGVEIYEGDILDFYDDECGKPNNLCGSRLEVLWLSDESRFGYKNRVPDHEYCSGFNGLWRENHYVVIGNIYDNPELLNTAEYGEREIRKHQI